MSDRLTIDEIDQRFPDEWVLIGDPETDDSLEVLSGEVLFHGSDRHAMYRAAERLSPLQRIATHYSGDVVDPDTVYVL